MFPGLAALLVTAASGATGVPATPAREAKLIPGSSHVYALELERGELVHLEIDRRQAALSATWRGPDGEELLRLEAPSGAREPVGVEWVVERAGTFELEVRLRPEVKAAAGYALRWLERRPATADDGQRVAALRAELRGDELGRSDELESQRAAAVQYEQALTLRQQVGDAGEQAWLHLRLGGIASRSGDLNGALAHFAAGLERARAAGRQDAVLALLDDTAYAHYRAGHRAEAVAVLQQMAELARQLGDVSAEASAAGNLGAVYLTADEDPQAILQLRRALALHQQAGDREQSAVVLNNLAGCYQTLGDLDRALDYFQQALALHRALGNRGGEARVLHNLGTCYRDLGDFRRARELVAQGAAIRRSLGQTRQAATSLATLAGIDRRLGDAAHAYREFEQYLALAEAEKDVRGRMIGVLGLAGCALDLGRPREALRRYEEGFALQRDMGEPRILARTLVGLASTHRALGDLERARDEIAAALEVFEAARAEVESPEARALYFGTRRAAYELGVDVLLRLHRRDPLAGYDRAAFQLSERARARSLVELLAASDTKAAEAIPDELRRGEQEAATSLSRVQLQLRRLGAKAAPQGQAREQLETELREAERHHLELVEQIRARDPRWAAPHFEAPPAVEEVQPWLAPRTALLEYLVGKDASYLFLVTHDSFQSFALPAEAVLRDRVGQLRDLLRRPGQRELGAFALAARELYRTLVQPAEASLAGKETLLISADGPLHYVPFEALLTAPPGGALDPTRLPYLLRRWSVAYEPSAAVLRRLRAPSGEAGAGKALLAVADPAYEPAGRSRNSSTEDSIGPLVRSVFGERSWSPRRLPEAAREAEQIADVFGRDASVVYLGEAATEENLKGSAELPHARRIHFATHALMSERQPQASGLVLALAAEPREDGLLQVREIFDLRLDADLVVLSACETGLGKLVRGEGPLGLTQAFLYAGARSVVVSLWQVADSSTADLMVELYRRQAAGLSKPAALRQAKLSLLADPRAAHPFYWAPFVLVGDPGLGSKSGH